MSGLWLGASGLWRGTAGLYSGASSLALGTGLYIGGVTDYAITIPGAVGEPGAFDVTIGTSGTIATASTDLPDLGSGFTWGIAIGGDARISVASTASGQPNTMDIETSSAILVGDTAEFTVTVTNGVLMLGFPFIAEGTVAGLMLDGRTAVATAAYSVRKLYALYAGSCLQFRRASDGALQDFGFSATPDANGNYWLDTAAIATFAPGGGSIKQWYDQTGNGRHAASPGTGSYPQYSATGWAPTTKPSLNFDGVTDYFWVPDHRGAFTDEMSLLVVANAGANASRTLFSTQQASGDNTGGCGMGIDASNKFYFIADPITGGRPTDTTVANFTNTNFSAIGSYDNTNGAVMSANAETITAAPGSGNLSFGGTGLSWGLGVFPPSTGSFWPGKLEEFVIFNTDIDATDKAAFRASHTTAFGVP